MSEKFNISPADRDIILNLLQERGWPIYEYYKPSSIDRRLHTCVSICKKSNLVNYINRLRSEPEEIDTLANALLVGVTSFFRDPAVFEAVRTKVIIPLLKNQKKNGDEIRVWSAACSTGQEAYSLAILFAEEAEKLKMQINMRFFASDVSSSGIHTASQGEYDEQGLDGLSEERINKWFIQENCNYWRVKRELRRMITFVRHDLTRDPPFPRMDLIFARNLLIYLNNSGQQRLHSIFHFSLKHDGILVVGDNEMTGNNHPLFNIVDPTNRLFTKNNDIKKDEQYHQSISVKRKADLPIFSEKRQKQYNPHRGNKYMNNQGLELTETWLSRNGQAGLLLNDEERILFTFGNIWDFIPPPRGLMTDISLHHLPCDTMRVTLREGIHQAADIQKDLEFTIVDDTGTKSVNIHIEPFKMPWGNNGYAVIFRHKTDDENQVFKPAQLNLDETTKLHIKSLEEDCARLKLELASEREQRLEDEEKLQAANEELRAANEEQQSINEELRATTDELTTKVKELTAANIEISRAHAAISGMESEKSAILNHLSEGIIYMTPDLSCQWANPLITDSVGISDPEAVRGRKCYEMTFGKDKPCKNCPAVRAIESGQVSEEMNVCLPDNRKYWLTAVPILDDNNKVVGVVEHRRDITEQTKLIEDLEQSRSEYANIIQDQSEFIVRFAPDLSITFANSSFCEYSGEDYTYAKSHDFHGNISEKYRKKVVKAIKSLSPAKPTITMEYPVKTVGGTTGWQHWTFRGIFTPSGEAVEYQGTGLDFTDRRSLEKNLAEREQLFRGIFESSPIAIELYDKSGSLTHVNRAFLDIFKVEGGEDAVKGFDLFSDPSFTPEEHQAIRKGEIIHKEVEVDLNDLRGLKISFSHNCSNIWCDITVSPLLPVGRKEPVGFLVQVMDITKRKTAEISLRESEERIKLAVDSTGLGMWELFPETGKTVISDKLFEITGYTKETFPYSVENWLQNVHPDDRETMKQALQSHLNGIRELYQTEFRFNHPEKGWIWLYALGSIVQYDEKGTPVRMIGFNQDISDLKNIERRWREALDGVGDGIWDLRLDTNKLFLSPALYKMAGYDVGEFPSSKEELHSRIHPEDLVMVDEILDAYIKEKIPEYNVEYRFMQKNGEWKWILSRGSIVERNHQGSPKRIIGTHQNINEMKSNQTRLTQYTEQLRIAQNLGKIGYFHHERNSDYLHFSDDFPDILNISTLRGNVKLSEFMKRIPVGDRKDFLKRLMQVNTSKTTSTYEVSLQIFDDNSQLRHLQAFGRINEGEDLIYGAIQDITEKKKTELKLRDSEQQLRNIFDNAPIGIALEDSDGRITICNRVLSDILGYSEEELLMKKFHDITHPDDIEMELELFDQLSGESPFYEMTKRYIKKDGEVIWGKLRSAILESQSSFCIKMVTDITEELQREAEIEKSRRVVRSLQEGLSDVIGEAFFDRLAMLLNQILDTDFCMITEQVPHYRDKIQTIIVRDSNSALENFKYAFSGTPCERVFSGKSYLCSSGVSEKFNLPERLNALNISGYIGVPLRSGNGKLLGILSIMTKNKIEHPDFIEHIMLLMASRATAELERQLTENQLIAAREKAEASNRAKSSFLANMGHEIRTPLNAIIGYSELLVMNEASDHVKKEAKSILSAGNALLGLINNILDLSRIEAGRMMINHTPTDIGHLVNEINSIFHQQAINKGISLKTFFDKGIPTLMLDQHRIMQILINLVGNAIKFTESGSITISINLLEKHLHSLKIKISVTDTGIGIAPENLERIFDSFEQADDTPARCYEGTGLGLTITRQLVDLMDGEIQVNSKVGEGTTFTIELTADVAANIEPQLSFESDQKIARKFKSAHILITDDNIDVLKVLCSQVESLGLTPLAASCPADAIKIAKENHIDLAFLDLRLGSSNGEDLAKDLSKLENMKNIPIFAISASLDPDSKYSSAYFSEVIPKPISISTLSNILANYLKSVQTPVKQLETKTLILDWVMPIEFHEEAQQKLSPLLDYFEGVIHVNKLKEAAKEIIAFAQSKDIPKMAAMANRLIEAADNFDLKIIDNIKEKMQSVLSDDYPENQA